MNATARQPHERESTLALAMEHTDAHAAMVVFDQRTELSGLLTRAYVECLPGARLISFDDLPPRL